jgi:hypothetical protein
MHPELLHCHFFAAFGSVERRDGEDLLKGLIEAIINSGIKMLFQAS